ncbi:TPA: Arc family DNA-binding protein [Pseudomonas aeruginosa]|nr:Arc family DNA-binding protein [Pseudomonas aeruginosa]HBP1602108.1 Arc family DNA-binding protein [Pseudomonas aeruginosa]
MKKTPVSRTADKFVVRMPDGMRERFLDYSNVKHVSMNTAIVQGLDSFLDMHAELQALLDGVRLLKQQLADQLQALEKGDSSSKGGN